MRDHELTLIENFRWWLGGLLPRWRGEAVTGVHASLAEAHAEISRLQNHVAELQGALVPFAAVGSVICSCRHCVRGSLEVTGKNGQAIIQNTDFVVAEKVMTEGGARAEVGLVL